MSLGLYIRKLTRNNKLGFYQNISTIAAIFSYASEDNYKEAIDDSLRLIGEFVRADRVYIFGYDFENNTCSNTFEYCGKGISSEIENLQNIPLEGIPDWVMTHLKGEVLYIPDVQKLPKADRVREILEPQGVKSLITIPLTKDGQLFGFLGFDSVLSKRKYTKTEQALLFEFAGLLVSLLKRIDMALALEIQKQKIDHIVDAANLGVWEWNLETDAVKYGKKWAELVGYELEELYPHTIDTWKNLTDPDDLAVAVDRVRQTIEGVNDRYECEFRMRHKDGHTVWIRDIGKVIEIKDGRPRTMIGAHIDISEAKRLNQLLDVKIKAIESAPAAIVITDREGNVEYTNPRFTEMTGYETEEAIGRNPRMLKSGEHDSRFYENMWETLTSGKTWKGEFHNRKKTGDTYWESAMIRPVMDERQTIVNYVAIKTDITEKKKQELLFQQLKENLEKEIRNMMEEVEESQKASIIALAKITESRDYETGKHVERVQHLSKALASALKETDKYKGLIDHLYLDDIFFASALHDIGKIQIPDHILLKPGKLDSEEFESIKQHAKIGSDILSEMVRRSPKRKFVMAARIAKCHHEQWDGSGYPEHLKGDEIPLEARIMSLVDVYDAMRSKRPYKNGYSHEYTVQHICERSGSQFDPEVVSAFGKLHTYFEVIYSSFE